jgi:predicted nucleotidyltransferase
MSNEMGHKSSSLRLGFRVAETSTSQEQVFELLLDGSGSTFTESQVREQLGLPRSTTHRALQELAAEGLVSSTAVGRTLLYSTDPDDPLVRHLKVARAISRVRAALAPITDLVDMAILFGSASRGDDGVGSDVDVLVVTRATDRVLGELSRHGWLQPVVMSPSEHMQLLAEGGAFARATTDGTVVWRRP